MVEVQGSQALEVKHVDPLKQKGGPWSERCESSEGSQKEKEGVIGEWQEQEKFNEDEDTV